MSSKQKVQAAWADLLAREEVTTALKAMVDEVTTRRSMRVDSIDCPRCRGMRKVDVEVELYPLSDAIKLMEFLARYGIGSPSQEVDVTVNLRAVQELSLEELATERQRLLGSLPELPPAA